MDNFYKLSNFDLFFIFPVVSFSRKRIEHKRKWKDEKQTDTPRQKGDARQIF